MSNVWPKLSEDLQHPRRPDTCQACGEVCDPAWNERWREHDALDRPTRVVVVLCDTCAKRLIEPHPRLYSRLQTHEPYPGSMPTCLDCRFRIGNECSHANLKANGGSGVPFRMPEPSVCFVDGRDQHGKRWGRQMVTYRGPVECDGKETR